VIEFFDDFLIACLMITVITTWIKR